MVLFAGSEAEHADKIPPSSPPNDSPRPSATVRGDRMTVRRDAIDRAGLNRRIPVYPAAEWNPGFFFVQSPAGKMDNVP